MFDCHRSCLEFRFLNIFKMTRQIFLKLSRILESAMVGAGKQHIPVHHVSMHAMVENGWNSKNIWNQLGQQNPSERGKIVKFGRSMLLNKNSELTGQTYDRFFPHERGQEASPQALCPRLRLLLSLKLGPKTTEFASPWRKFLEVNQYASKQCCRNILCFLTFFG